ncbi:hypothetical protein SISSUDRAFT_870026 [Sistotremastrum suecicum HHB10207 ss-3]|uniref:Uncharacterized protein n=1 Tax=Sistotremastrum suecicum HHB10207 ss-3 TaxID=1314776 RepID=A0A166CEN2_9AGAM|nr:hypothetical protein SISSUDRAFT_870026 [Sistotremastrum suecicum HHB10207 ss-3]
MPSAPTSSAQAGAVNAPDIRNAENVLKDTLSSFSNQIPECYTLFRQGGLYLDQEKELKESWDSAYESFKGIGQDIKTSVADLSSGYNDMFNFLNVLDSGEMRGKHVSRPQMQRMSKARLTVAEKRHQEAQIVWKQFQTLLDSTTTFLGAVDHKTQAERQMMSQKLQQFKQQMRKREGEIRKRTAMAIGSSALIGTCIALAVIEPNGVGGLVLAVINPLFKTVDNSILSPLKRQ